MCPGVGVVVAARAGVAAAGRAGRPRTRRHATTARAPAPREDNTKRIRSATSQTGATPTTAAAHTFIEGRSGSAAGSVTNACWGVELEEAGGQGTWRSTRPWPPG